MPTLILCNMPHAMFCRHNLYAAFFFAVSTIFIVLTVYARAAPRAANYTVARRTLRGTPHNQSQAAPRAAWLFYFVLHLNNNVRPLYRLACIMAFLVQFFYCVDIVLLINKYHLFISIRLYMILYITQQIVQHTFVASGQALPIIFATVNLLNLQPHQIKYNLH